MAVELDDRSDNNVWALFVRNWGDEGFCGQLNHELYMPDDRIRIALPRVGDRPEIVLANSEFRSTSGAMTFPDISYDSGTRQAVLTFPMPEPRRRIVGEMILRLNWGNGFASIPPTLVRAPAAREAASPDTDAEAYFDSVSRNRPELRRRLLEGERGRAATVGQTVAATPPTSARLADFVPGQAAPGRPTRRLSIDQAKRSADLARWKAVCDAYSNTLPRFKGRDVSGICAKVR
jgi:hypothetical protein